MAEAGKDFSIRQCDIVSIFNLGPCESKCTFLHHPREKFLNKFLHHHTSFELPPILNSIMSFQ